MIGANGEVALVAANAFARFISQIPFWFRFELGIIRPMPTAQSERLGGREPEQFDVSDSALNHSENQRTALWTTGVVIEMCKGC